jgi:molybdopterin-containing oxidoreductase family iron-sulfur binding subunit
MSGSEERRYWKSTDELAAGAAVQPAPDEFPAGAADAPDGITRRTMLQLVGASLSLAGLAGCRRPVEHIVPYVNAPEDIIPGIPRQYATTMPFATSALGVLVESHEARPTKIEGNELHPASGGAASAWAQAAVYGLYDPDRARSLSRTGGATAQPTWKDFVDYWKPLHDESAANQGAGLALILEPFASPTEARRVAKLRQRFPSARVVAYAPLGGENVAAGIAAATGADHEPVYHLEQARVILSLDADFLLEDRDAVRHGRAFASGRRVAAPGDAMNRLYAVESALTITGVAADHRLRLQSGRIAAFTAALAAALGMGPAAPGAATDIDQRWLQAVAGDLKNNRGKCVIIAGAHQPAAVHAAVAALNAGLGNVGNTVTYVNAPETMRSSTPALQQLADEMRAGTIKTVVVLGGNPVYDAPADVDFGGALAKVANRIRLGSHVDETAQACEWHLPEAHFLEAWGDARSVGGPLSVVQPLIAPLFDGKSAIELLALLESGQEVAGYDLVRETWQATLPGDFEPAWKRVLHDGVLAGSEPAPVAPAVDMAPLAALAASPFAAAAPATAESLEIVFRPSAAVYDGRFANNGWLQELPDPVSKLTWDNAALLSAATAQALGVTSGDMVRLALHEREIEAAVMVLPGSADGSLTIALGYGRPAAGRIGTRVGFNAYPLRTARPAGFDTGLTLQRTGNRYPFAVTSEHWSMEGRVIVQEATVEEFRREPDLARAHEASLRPMQSPWEQVPNPRSPQWGMTIDLNACIGCNACIVACQSENNIPVVGKDQVSRGREMQWIRVDRYFSGRPDAPESIVFQPVPCQHCENAPCEQVCPVAATMHDSEGRNVMVYNRCIGTRYCSNNCPYKVRRFNFYNFTGDMPDTLELVQNPNVTVRARGVMEKCTYCLQRANRASIDARLAGRQLADGDVRTACQQTCPAEAIQFGDIRDPKSRVSAEKASPRNYVLLAELNTRPRTTYLMRLRNPNPELEKS